MAFYPSGGAVPPSGAAGGVLTGTYPNPGLFGQTTQTGATAALAGNWVPADNALLAATSTLDGFGGTSAILIAGTLYLSKCQIRQAITWTTMNYVVATAGVGASTGSFVGLYNSAGTLLTGSADIGVNLATAGAYATALTTPQALTAGTFVWAAILVNLATTQPIMRQQSTPSAATVDLGLTAATFRSATNGTGLTTLPASITPASNSGTGINPWFGAS